jgi:hypothetical protein
VQGCAFRFIAYSSTLKMKVVCCSVTPVSISRTTRRHIPEDCDPRSHLSGTSNLSWIIHKLRAADNVCWCRSAVALTRITTLIITIISVITLSCLLMCKKKRGVIALHSAVYDCEGYLLHSGMWYRVVCWIAEMEAILLSDSSVRVHKTTRRHTTTILRSWF